MAGAFQLGKVQLLRIEKNFYSNKIKWKYITEHSFFTK